MMLFIHGTFNLMYVFDEYWFGLLLWRVKRISLCFVISMKKKNTLMHLGGSLFVIIHLQTLKRH